MDRATEIIVTYLMDNRVSLYGSIEELDYYDGIIRMSRRWFHDPMKNFQDMGHYEQSFGCVGLQHCAMPGTAVHAMATQGIDRMEKPDFLLHAVNDLTLYETQQRDLYKNLVITYQDSDAVQEEKLDRLIAQEEINMDELVAYNPEGFMDDLLSLPVMCAAKASLYLENLDMLRLELAERFKDNRFLVEAPRRSLLSIVYGDPNRPFASMN